MEYTFPKINDLHFDFHVEPVEPEPAPPSPIPEGYTALNYIQSSGEQWIDMPMDIPESTDAIQVQVKFAFISVPSGFQEIVAMSQYWSDVSTPYGLFFGSDANGNFFAKVSHPEGTGGTAICQDIDISAGTVYDASITVAENQLTAAVNDGTETVTEIVATESGLTLPLMLFATRLGNYGVMEYSTAKMYYCRIYKNGTLVHHLLPCSRNADSKIGMYDVAQETFLTNGGSGADFTGG